MNSFECFDSDYYFYLFVYKTHQQQWFSIKATMAAESCSRSMSYQRNYYDINGKHINENSLKIRQFIIIWIWKKEIVYGRVSWSMCLISLIHHHGNVLLVSYRQIDSIPSYMWLRLEHVFHYDQWCVWVYSWRFESVPYPHPLHIVCHVPPNLFFTFIETCGQIAKKKKLKAIRIFYIESRTCWLQKKMNFLRFLRSNSWKAIIK